MKAENLIVALYAAIAHMEAQGRGDSALVSGWKEVIAKLERGELPTIQR